jgi:cell division protein ZapA
VKESIEVTILGKTYAFRSEFDQKFMNETAKLVNQKMHEIISRTGAVTSEKVAILAAMNLAGDLLKMKDDTDSVKSHIKTSSSKILQIVNSLL